MNGQKPVMVKVKGSNTEFTTDILLHIQIFKLPLSDSDHTTAWCCFRQGSEKLFPMDNTYFRESYFIKNWEKLNANCTGYDGNYISPHLNCRDHYRRGDKRFKSWRIGRWHMQNFCHITWQLELLTHYSVVYSLNLPQIIHEIWEGQHGRKHIYP